MRMVDAPLSCVDPLFEASPWRLLRRPRDASRFPGRIIVDPVPAAFRWRRSGCPGPPAVQSRHVRECGTASPQEAVVWLRSAHESGERSRSGMNRIMSRNTARSAAHLKRFYDLLSVLEHRIGGPRRLVNCSGRMDWPCRSLGNATAAEKIGHSAGLSPPNGFSDTTTILRPSAGSPDYPSILPCRRL